MMLSRKALLALVLCGGLPAAAAAEEGYYISGAGGAVFAEDSDYRSSGGGIGVGGVDVDLDYDTGWGVAGALGYAHPDGGLRTEIELGFRTNDLDSLGGVDAGGDADIFNLMVNALYDFDLGMSVFPYAGFGIGGVRFSLDSDTADALGNTVDDEAISFAYQGIAGLGYRLSERIALTADYRFLGVPNMNFDTVSGSPNTRVNSDYHSHSIMVGLRLTFPAPKPAPPPEPAVVEAPPPAPEPAPAPPAPEPAPPPPSTYLVFFDWDVAALTAEARDIVQEAARNAREVGPTRIEVTGHADRSGPTDYNMGLSQRRAENVKAELMRQGIPENEIAVFAEGETDPLVPTPDGVREPQNRRVEIIFAQ